MQLLIQKVHTISLHNSILRSHSFGISQFRLRIQTAVADFLFPSHSCTRAKKESGRIGPKPSVRLHKKWRKCFKKSYSFSWWYTAHTSWWYWVEGTLLHCGRTAIIQNVLPKTLLLEIRLKKYVGEREKSYVASRFKKECLLCVRRDLYVMLPLGSQESRVDPALCAPQCYRNEIRSSLSKYFHVSVFRM